MPLIKPIVDDNEDTRGNAHLTYHHLLHRFWKIVLIVVSSCGL